MLIVALRAAIEHDGNALGRVHEADYWVGLLEICMWVLLNVSMACKTQCFRKTVKAKGVEWDIPEEETSDHGQTKKIQLSNPLIEQAVVGSKAESSGE
jgi:hypothetical protein